MKKAERIFRDIYTECRLHIKAWGYEENSRFRSISENELVYTRTKNEIKKLIETEKKNIALELKLSIITEERATLLSNAIKMVENTLENTYIS